MDLPDEATEEAANAATETTSGSLDADAPEVPPISGSLAEQAEQLVPMLMAACNGLTHIADEYKPDCNGDGIEDTSDSAPRAELVARLRHCMMLSYDMAEAAARGVRMHQLALPPTSRAGYLRMLDEIIGPPPARHFSDEWVELRIEAYKLGGKQQQQYANREYVTEHNLIDAVIARNNQWIDPLVAAGWERADAEVFILLSPCRSALSRALSERDPSYAAATYTLNRAVYRSRKEGVAPKLYVNIPNPFLEAGFSRLEKADRTGFRGLTTTAIVKAFCDDGCFTEAGYCHLGGTGKYTLQDGDVVCFESRPDDEHGAHSAIMLEDETRGCFPMNCLFRLKAVHAPGTWEAPNGVYPQRKLLVVTATYHPPSKAEMDTHARQLKAGPTVLAASKMCGVPNMLKYENTSFFVAGLDALLARPTLTMAEEFARDVAWTDWKDKSYTLKAEWDYVTGVATAMAGCTPGERDKTNDGKTPNDFLREVNAHIAQRRVAGHGSLPEDVAYLTMNELLGVRLYSGPAYQPLNGFLRDISRVRPSLRRHISEHPRLTYVATVGHICSAIRKLANIATPEEATTPLWRGVRGRLPTSFWMADDSGIMCAVDLAFMSTSRERQAPIDYMSADADNVMWALQPQVESDTAYHFGADISMLSQFGEEKEVLYPPCTMLQVKQYKPGERPHAPLSFKMAVQKAHAITRETSMEPPEEEEEQEVGRNDLLGHLKRSVRRGGTLGATLGLIIEQSNAKAQVTEEDGKPFLLIEVLPRFM